MGALFPWRAAPVPTRWLDADDLSLAHVLALARYAGARRVMLTGANPGPAWFLGELPEGWTHGRHHLDHATPVGRYDLAGASVEIRRAAEWFGEGDYTPETARNAWDALADLAGRKLSGAPLLGSPGATGREAWIRALPLEHGRTIAPAQLDPELSELIRATSGQHRIELLPAPDAATMPDLWVLDGRLMYAACVRELGTADGARMLTAGEAADLLERNPHARARYLVRATVPAGWDRVGILPHAGDDGDTWTYPSEPGRTFETWADSAECFLALEHGWKLEPAAAILFGKGRPLDTWAARILGAYDGIDPNMYGRQIAAMLRAALRWMLLHAVGAWHSSGRTDTTVTASPMERPAGAGWEPPERTDTGAAIWRRRVPLEGRAALMAHPEYSAQIWGRARARVLSAPTAIRGVKAGALHVHPASLVSIYGDALMTTTRPEWATPAHDDGKPGRLRVKGHLPGPVPWPATARERDALMHRAEAHTKENQQ